MGIGEPIVELGNCNLSDVASGMFQIYLPTQQEPARLPDHAVSPAQLAGIPSGSLWQSYT